jgi:hypothetical protein
LDRICRSWDHRPRHLASVDIAFIDLLGGFSTRLNQVKLELGGATRYRRRE